MKKKLLILIFNLFSMAFIAAANNTNKHVAASAVCFEVSKFKTTTSTTSLFKLNLWGANVTFNQIAIGYIQGATNGVDNQIDAVPFAINSTMVSSLINNIDYVIQGRALPFSTSDVVSLGFRTDVAGNYSFTTDAFEGVFAGSQAVFVKDNLTGIIHNVKQSPYHFSSNIGIFNSRFEIVYLSSENPPIAISQVFCSNATVGNLVAVGTNLKWYATASGGTELATNTTVATGIYYVSQTDANTIESARTSVLITIKTTTWTGNSWTNGPPDASKGAVFTGNYSESIDLTACSLEVVGTAIVSIPSGFDCTVINDLKIAPTASLVFENNANLLQNAAAINTGIIKINRNTNVQRLAYTHWSSPVVNQNALAFSPQTIATRFYNYNETNDTFVVMANPSATNLIPAVGYAIRAPNTFPTSLTEQFIGAFTGTPNNGNYIYPATRGSFGYNLVGNPYPSTMLASAFFAANPLVTALYFWNNAILNAPAGHNFATKTNLTAIRATSDINSSKVPTDFIGIGQGFFIQVSSPTNVVFNNTLRSSENNSVFFRNANDNKSVFKLNLLSPTSTFNQIAIGYLNGATNGDDNQIDAKPFAQSNTMISSLINTFDYVIQGRPLPFSNSDVVPLGFKTDVAGNYSFTTEAFEGVFANNQNIFLKDNLIGITHNIKQSPYNFTSNIGTYNHRFEIVYVNSVLGHDNPNFDANNVFVFINNNIININSGKTNMKNIQVFDIRGRLIFDEKDMNTTTFAIKSLKVEHVCLIVKITSEYGQILTKKIAY